MSMGFLVPEGAPIVWRGLMVCDVTFTPSVFKYEAFIYVRVALQFEKFIVISERILLMNQKCAKTACSCYKIFNFT